MYKTHFMYKTQCNQALTSDIAESLYCEVLRFIVFHNVFTKLEEILSQEFCDNDEMFFVIEKCLHLENIMFIALFCLRHQSSMRRNDLKCIYFRLFPLIRSVFFAQYFTAGD